MKGRKRTLRKGLSGKILSFTMALAMVANLMGGYCAATELSTKEVKAADAEQPPYRNVMYYGDWSIYSGQKNFTPDKIDGSLITHLNFAFMDADANGDLITTDTWADYENPNVGFSVGTDNKYAGVLGAKFFLVVSEAAIFGKSPDLVHPPTETPIFILGYFCLKSTIAPNTPAYLLSVPTENPTFGFS